MGRGRPKLYHTAEEKLMANRAKSKRSYYKNKPSVRAQTDTSEVSQTAAPPVYKPTGRPKLYRTPEEKAMANRAKSKRSYNKCKIAISARKAVRYRAETHGRHSLFKGARREPHPNLDPVTVVGWMKLVSKTSAEFDARTGGSPQSYLEGLCQNYMVSRRKDKLSDACIHLEGLRNVTTRCLNGILQLAGVGKELGVVQTLGRAVGQVLAWLEDALCAVMCGYSEVVDMHRTRQLMYQSA
ncbi:hypothetical protein PLEOSDRAFT_1108088 [Pleurotus ostreatus PC15]|uniref:Uncharacterized protein n=1 Tax=Pleurotus ostreatus (strain PC15) TaxID=1137138 RepID=A0A067N6D2_PLEO1|nr:hypothetical protein PLEOSDRAFT_1108088 [Pleurotus ostreatus PC15]